MYNCSPDDYSPKEDQYKYPSSSVFSRPSAEPYWAYCPQQEEQLNSGVWGFEEPTFQDSFGYTNQSGIVTSSVQLPSSMPKEEKKENVIENGSWEGKIKREPPDNGQASKPRQKKRTGGRRPCKNVNWTDEEERRRAIRRERNKLAAARCRKRRLDHTNELIIETEGLLEEKEQLKKEVQQLIYTKKKLQEKLASHKTPCKVINMYSNFYDMKNPVQQPDLREEVNYKKNGRIRSDNYSLVFRTKAEPNLNDPPNYAPLPDSTTDFPPGASSTLLPPQQRCYSPTEPVNLVSL